MDLQDAHALISSHPYPAYLFDLHRTHTDLGEWKWIIVSLNKQWLQLQLLYQMRSPRLSKLTHPLVPGVQLMIWQILFFFSFHSYF